MDKLGRYLGLRTTLRYGINCLRLIKITKSVKLTDNQFDMGVSKSWGHL